MFMVHVFAAACLQGVCGQEVQGSNRKMATKMKRKAEVHYHGLSNEGSNRKEKAPER